jgi:uncharacterized protein YlbG (UPF0298 family)
LEYKDVVKKVLEKWPTRPITIYVDMKDVDRAAKKVCVVRLTKYVKLTPFNAIESHIGRLRGRER